MNLTLEAKLILQPLCGQVLLTLLIWSWMYYTRLTTMAKFKIDPQNLADTEGKGYEILKSVQNPSDNFENLFEMPILFYIALIVLYITNTVDSLYLNLAWFYVVFRSIHSLIHCTFNKITLRFTAYLFSSLALWCIWIRIGFNVFGVN